MGSTNSHHISEPPQALMDGPRYPLPDFNDIFHNGVPKMMQVADDMHRMTNYIMDLRNMTLGLSVISVVGVILFMILKWQNGRRAARSRRRFSKFNNPEYGSEHSSLSRPYRTYPQKQIDPWQMQHPGQHRIEIDPVASAPNGPNTTSTTTTTTSSTVPNGGHVVRAPFGHKFSHELPDPPVKLLVEDLPYADNSMD